MVDVLHYMYEEDVYYTSKESAQVRDAVRTTVYKLLYGKKYKYAVVSDEVDTFSQHSTLSEFEAKNEEIPVPFDPNKQSKVVLPYIPVTEGDATSSHPFGPLLNGPIEKL